MAKNLTEDQLEDMGLVKISEGNWSVPMKKKVTQAVFSVFVEPPKVIPIKRQVVPFNLGPPTSIITIPDLPVYYKIKGKKHYLTAQIFYAGVHFGIRTQIVNRAKRFLKRRLGDLKPFKPRSTLLLRFACRKVISSATLYDIDNRGYFWGKVFLDLLQKDKKYLVNDGVYWVDRVVYEFDHDLKEDRLTIKIY